MGTQALRKVLEFIPCTHKRGCTHCHAVEELKHIERASMVMAAEEEATDDQRKQAFDLFRHIASERAGIRMSARGERMES